MTFIEICFKDFYDKGEEFVQAAVKANPFLLFALGQVSDLIHESLKFKKAKKQLKSVSACRPVRWGDFSNPFYMQIFEKIGNIAREAFEKVIVDEL